MATELTSSAISQQEWLDPIADQVQPIIARTLHAAGGQPLNDFLNGVWLGHPLHPVLTDIPLGAWTVTAVCDALEEINGHNGFGHGADAALKVGLAGALGAAVTGMADWQHLDGQPRRVGLLHALLNTASLALYVRSWHMRARHQRRAGRGFAFLGYAVSMASAYLGGQLVYSHRIGVDQATQTLPVNTPASDFVPVLADTALPANTLRRVEVQGIPILLVRRGDTIHALAETCSHLSGPLAEGQLEGDSVVCPWHGSRFALSDGHVLNGPATHPQPCFLTRVRNGHIEVCPQAHAFSPEKNAGQ